MKERLTGAIILVALIVLVVPELLTGPLRGKPAGSARPAASTPAPFTASPSKAPPPVRSYTLILPSPGSGAAPVRDGPAPVQGANQTVQAPGGVRSAQVAPATVPPAPAARPDTSPRADAGIVPASEPKPLPQGDVHSREGAPARPASPPLRAKTPARHRPQPAGRWVVQLASFSSHANALRLARRLRRGHFPVAVAPLRFRGRLWWRVWVGPVAGRAAARRLARRLGPIGSRGEVLRE